MCQKLHLWHEDISSNLRKFNTSFGLLHIVIKNGLLLPKMHRRYELLRYLYGEDSEVG